MEADLIEKKMGDDALGRGEFRETGGFERFLCLAIEHSHS